MGLEEDENSENRMLGHSCEEANLVAEEHCLEEAKRTYCGFGKPVTCF
jgi:hypothetical protein